MMITHERNRAFLSSLVGKAKSADQRTKLAALFVKFTFRVSISIIKEMSHIPKKCNLNA